MGRTRRGICTNGFTLGGIRDLARRAGIALRRLLAGQRVQLVALAQQGDSVEVVAPEVLLGYPAGVDVH